MAEDKNEDFIITYSKLKFSPIAGKAEHIDVIDIAHALSLMCRANGHIKHFYSVAQHSLNCALEAKVRGLPDRIQLACLLHDASEAYLSDITRPVKRSLPKYMEYEDVLQTVIYRKFFTEDLTERELLYVKGIDDAMLYYELLELMDEPIFAKAPELQSLPDFRQREFQEVEKEFIRLFDSLFNKSTL
ncbi:phosphohydrolase [Sinanaerobacter chloroacetimidivorans]|uniref:Phosphohydrolase n=1 Tax=Sinanaerobacter chloroacetimidivorans TaxID=2818044 RepID=A0A8J8B0B3_9FIRM|nr:phosphohydrolase [Sinanaerobacter chloroacetimidivorans]MBR0597009.1 phosphohydrolase [Sinanaerobacter chloroacetimidivorans]